MSNEYTAEQVREVFLSQIRCYVHYWSAQNRTEKEKLEGLAFGILNIIDGTSAGIPSFDLVVRPHPDDKQFNISEGNDYYQNGMVINGDCYLHDLFYKDESK